MRSMLCALALSILVFFVGCTIHSLAPGYTLIAEKESIVIGGLKLPQDVIPYVSGPMYGAEGAMRINTIIGRNYREYKVAPVLDGNVWRFVIALPQGRYRITDIYWGELEGSINGIFNVYENGKVYYIGLLDVKRSSRRMIKFFAFSDYPNFPLEYKILDDFADALRYYKQAYPGLPHDVEKSMVYYKKDWDRSYNQFTPAR
ncbi:MAG: hypothetical protein JXA07_13035 [Spirochaetes bacterium]|nr:hypothetical protein [Spirochaetota bacterium]